MIYTAPPPNASKELLRYYEKRNDPKWLAREKERKRIFALDYVRQKREEKMRVEDSDKRLDRHLQRKYRKRDEKVVFGTAPKPEAVDRFEKRPGYGYSVVRDDGPLKVSYRMESK